MKYSSLLLLLLFMVVNSSAQQIKPITKLETVYIDYNGREVKARTLLVQSRIPMSIKDAWRNVKSPALLEFVAKGMINFKSVGEILPKQWQVGRTYAVRMRILGFIPFGGIHYLFIEKIEEDNFKISTKEWDKGAKVWNHQITMRDMGDGSTYYEDSVTIYGGRLTMVISSFAKRFYVHRQRRWQLVAANNLRFGE
jgi:hypothetical protein